jgi:hypothetical protein
VCSRPCEGSGSDPLDWKSVVADDWVPCPGSALGVGGAAPDQDYDWNETGTGFVTPSSQRGAAAGMRVGRVAQGKDKDAVPSLTEVDARAEPTLGEHPLLSAVDRQDRATLSPPHDRDALLRMAHVAFHKGTKAMAARLVSEGHSWPGMAVDCQRIARECVECQRYTVQRYGFHPQCSITAALPLDHLAIDLFMLPMSSDGYNYLSFQAIPGDPAHLSYQTIPGDPHL